MLARIAAFAASLLVAGCSMFGDRSGTEEPTFDVVATVGAVEIRRYGPRLAAETTIQADEEAARNQGFRRLAGYIFGANSGKAEIAMTAPVSQQAGSEIAMTAPVSQARDATGAWVVRFFLPRQWTMASLPRPNDPAVRLVTIPGETVAVLRFTGDRGASAVAARQAELLRALENAPWRAEGTPYGWFYDPPWTLPWLRRNEVVVPVVGR